MPANFEDGTLLQCFVAVRHVSKMMGRPLVLVAPRSTDPPMTVGGWVVYLSLKYSGQIGQVLARPASIQWLDIPNPDGVVGFIECTAVTLHVCIV